MSEGEEGGKQGEREGSGEDRESEEKRKATPCLSERHCISPLIRTLCHA